MLPPLAGGEGARSRGAIKALQKGDQWPGPEAGRRSTQKSSALSFEVRLSESSCCETARRASPEGAHGLGSRTAVCKAAAEEGG